jgi:hypothetical protein
MTLDGILARISAIWHKVIHPRHKLVWRSDPVLDDPEFKCEGDIFCETCEMFFWCRYYDNPTK